MNAAPDPEAPDTILPQTNRRGSRFGSRYGPRTGRRGSQFSIRSLNLPALFSKQTSNIGENFEEDQPTGTNIKCTEERAFIESALNTNYLFQDHFSDGSLILLSSAFVTVEYQKGDVIFNQGDATDNDDDFMLILGKGECAVTIDGVAIPDPYGTIGRGTMVGELALLMESKYRSATVTAKTNIVAFRLDRASFKRFMAGPHEKVEDIKAEILKIDQTIDKISGVRTHYGGDIIRKFKPSRAWLWGRWSGTILQQAWPACFVSMLVTSCFVAAVRYFTEPTWELGQVPDPTFPLISRLVPLTVLWKYLMNVTTFILTFFLAQAYSMWRNMYDTTRTIQGRLSHIVLLVASTVERDEHGKLSEKAEHLVEDIGHYVRLFHVFNWASYSKKFAVISTNRGLSRMLSRGLISRKEYNTLTSLQPTGGPHHTCIMWILVRVLSAMKNGTLPNDHAMREMLFDRVCGECLSTTLLTMSSSYHVLHSFSFSIQTQPQPFPL